MDHEVSQALLEPPSIPSSERSLECNVISETKAELLQMISVMFVGHLGELSLSLSLERINGHFFRESNRL
ncbi:hypothetical protein RJ639_030334 [Escallonia herrerae]|uniref:Uncharacterized protein n=1 Tax=Escallonia herrerae TaxID=1293975 RepID=A0AA88X0P4_9ASTE|nr:hypothetical protein RJ639_030334 [Escallonia herrerae]